MAAQLQHIACAIPGEKENEVDSTLTLLQYVAGVDNVAEGLEGLPFAKSNTFLPTFVLMQNIWNNTRLLQNIQGFTRYSPIWHNGHYAELQQCKVGPDEGNMELLTCPISL